MKEKFVKIHGLSDLTTLTSLANEVKGEVSIKAGRYIVDGKSILGVLSLKTDAGMLIEYPENAMEFENFIMQFEAERE